MSFLSNKYRALVVGVTFLCLTAINSNYIVVNFTIICMSGDMSETITQPNGNVTSRYAYTPAQQSMGLWAVALGSVIGTFPYSWAFIQYGARFPFLLAGLLSMGATAAIPLAAHLSFIGVLFLRFIQGVSYAADFSVLGVVTVKWAPLDETSIFIAIMTSFVTYSPFITNLVSSWFCTSSLGWKFSFYAHAAFTAVCFAAWLGIYGDEPSKHSRVKKQELLKIQKDKTKEHLEADNFVPYKAILTTPTVYAIWLNGFAEITTITVLLTYMPQYFHTVLGFDVTSTGILSAVAALIHAPIKYISGYCSDKITWISEHRKLQICNFFAVGLAGLFFFAIGIVKKSGDGVTGVALFFAIYLVMGANCGAYWKCAALVSRQYAHFVLSVNQFMKCLALATAPGSWLLFVRDEKDVVQWSYVYYLNGALLIVANVVFFFMCSDKPAAFTKMTRDNPTGKMLASPDNHLERIHQETIIPA
ncbi:unnamed protein product, partial [Mesorhabditis belari]|uniref:Major facilitator superfamily (MFS) profile domain-containing protein n=1 Tax=Mesorhabditis belari TaxID=2138241 RepID=A0AAF3EMI4_9BILA